jgi:hypothetical protein
MRNANRRFIVRGFCSDTGDVHSFQTEDGERAAAMAKQLSEDLVDMQVIDRRARRDASQNAG